MVKLSDELKAAIVNMPSIKKDKLLLRLIAKDKILTEKLEHELLGTEADVDEKVAYLEQLITQNIPPMGMRGLTPGFLMMDMRPLNSKITHHVKITKDKVGAVILTTLLLLLAFERHFDMLEAFPRRRSETFTKYTIQRLNFILKTANKLHEDYHIEFEENLNKLLAFVYRFDSTAMAAAEAGIPRRWE